MGFLDRFRKADDDPIKAFAKMDHRRLREFHARVQVDLNETVASLKRHKDEYARLTHRAAGLSDRHERMMVEGQARQLLQRVQLLDRNFRSQVRTGAVTAFLLGTAQEGLGAKGLSYETELKSILRMSSPRELGQALGRLSKKVGGSNAYVDEVQGLIDSYMEEPLGEELQPQGGLPELQEEPVQEPAAKAKRKDVMFEGR